MSKIQTCDEFLDKILRRIVYYAPRAKTPIFTRGSHAIFSVSGAIASFRVLYAPIV